MTERMGGSDTDPKAGSTNIIDIPAKIPRMLLERRAREIEEGVKKIEATQVLPAETMRLQFHAPGEG